MKKFISLAIVAVMLVSMLAVNTSAANTYIPKGTEVPMFTKAPDFDGKITKEEWVGEPTISFTVSEASKANTDGVSAQNVYFDNTYSQLSDDELAAMKTDVWFRYDANYLYMGVIVYDPTGNVNVCPNGNELWNGDNIQIKIDPQGPNSAMYALDKNFDWTKTPFSNDIFPTEIWDDNWDNEDGTYGNYRPLKNNEYKPYWFLNCDKLADYTAALANDTVVVFNNTDPHVLLENRAIAVIPAPTAACPDAVETHYEIALPWSEIYKEFQNLAPTAGTALGVVLGITENYGVTNAENWRYYDSCYSWGTGLYGGQAVSFPDTIGGTNALILLDESTARTPYEVYIPPVVEDNNNNNDANVDNGAADDNKDEGTKSPQTGDSVLFVALIAACCLAVVTALTKKRLASK